MFFNLHLDDLYCLFALTVFAFTKNVVQPDAVMVTEMGGSGNITSFWPTDVNTNVVLVQTGSWTETTSHDIITLQWPVVVFLYQ